MSPAATQLGPAFAATPFQVASLTEDQARAEFRRWRFASSNGQPVCPKCGCENAYELRCRPAFKCLNGHQFSLTSGTPFAYRKLPYKKIIYLLSCFAQAKQGISALQACRDLQIQHKTAFVWFHKMRAALQGDADKIQLGGQVEIDGAWWGGKMRPKNTRKEPKHVRRSVYRHAHLRMSVVVAAERNGGPLLTWVAQREEWPARAIVRRLAPGTVVFTDEGNWTPLDRFARYSVNHSQTFCTEVACTNLAENFHSVMRYLGKTHRRIADRYLDLYSTQAAWTIRIGKSGPSDRFGSLMMSMLSPGRSPLTGYFRRATAGGSKRLCRVIQKDGRVGGWRPPSKDERRKLRETRKEAIESGSSKPDAKALQTLRRSAKLGWREGFQFLFAEEVASNERRMPDAPGVYALLLPAPALPSAILHEAATLPLWEVDAFQAGYAGESSSLRRRIREHLSAELWTSNLRDTLFALAYNGLLALDVRDWMDRAACEATLTAWLRRNALIGFKPCSYCGSVERQMLAETRWPLNARDVSERSARLLHARARFDAEVKARWPAPAQPARPIRR